MPVRDLFYVMRYRREELMSRATKGQMYLDEFEEKTGLSYPELYAQNADFKYAMDLYIRIVAELENLERRLWDVTRQYYKELENGVYKRID